MNSEETAKIKKLKSLISKENNPQVVKELKKEIYCIENYYTKDSTQTREKLGFDGDIRHIPLHKKDMRRVPISLNQAIEELMEFD